MHADLAGRTAGEQPLMAAGQMSVIARVLDTAIN